MDDNGYKTYSECNIDELDQIVNSIEDSPVGTGRMDFWLEDIVDDELVSRNLPSE